MGKLVYLMKDFFKYFVYRAKLISSDNMQIAPICSCRPHSHYLSVCAIIKNESAYLREWLEYHLIQGVECFYLYDNDSNDLTYEILKPFIDRKIVLYHKVFGDGMQLQVYNDCIVRYREYSKWIAFIDADEFIVPLKTRLFNFLKAYDLCVGICVNWVMFDSNGYEKKPVNKLVIETYTRVHKNFSQDNMHIKSIVNPKYVKYFVNPHYPLFKSFKSKVNENSKKIRLAWTNPKDYSIRQIRINHYFSKSREEYEAKISRGMADHKEKVHRPYEELRINFSDGIQDDSMKEYVSILRKKCGLE